MENKGNNMIRVSSQNIFKKYIKNTSPLVNLQNSKRMDTLKDQLRHNVSMKLECIKNRGSKNYVMDNSASFCELKANAVLYQIPEFSTPEINYEVSQQIKKKVQEAKNQIITHLPEISKSSNYAPKKIQHQINHRSVVKELEQWLKEKLKNPPVNCEESIQYKNMIMGVGMKELIRLIGKRCNEQGRMVEQIWQLTWSICRQIILYLSKRAKKCQQILDDELSIMQKNYNNQFQRLISQNKQLKERIAAIQEQNNEIILEMNKMNKKNEFLQEQIKKVAYDNTYLRHQFKNVLEQNLAIYLHVGDKNKRGWIQKVYKNILCTPNKQNKQFTNFYKKQASLTVLDRVQLQQKSGECNDKIDQNQLETITQSIQKLYENKNSMDKNGKIIQQSEEQSQCAEFKRNMEQEFQQIESGMQTDIKQFNNISVGTLKTVFEDFTDQVHINMLVQYLQIGVNTQEVKQQVKPKKKQNSKNQSILKTKQNSKIFKNIPVFNPKQKTKTKIQMKKQLNSILPAQQQKQSLRTEQISENIQSKQRNTIQINIINNEVKNDFLSISQNRQQFQNNNMVPLDGKESLNKNKDDKDLSNQSKNYKHLSSQNKNVYNIVKVQSSKQFLTIPHNQFQIPKSQLFSQKIQNKMAKITLQKIKHNNKQSEQFIHMTPQQQQLIEQIQQQFKKQQILQKINEIQTVQDIKSANISIQQIYKQQNIILCANCHKILNKNEQKYAFHKNKKIKHDNLQENNESSEIKKTIESCNSSFDQIELNQRHQHYKIDGPIVNRNSNRKNSGFLHDISYKKDMDQIMSSSFYKSLEENIQKGQEIDPNEYNFKKSNQFRFLQNSLNISNKQFMMSITNNQQVSQNLQAYFEMVRQINMISDSKIMMKQKSIVSIIEKNIYPILQELLTNVKKAVKYHRVLDTMKNFVSLPNIIYNRINRKYGVKILATKNIKALLMALKLSLKITQKYKVIELMMFTDCKSPNSEDLFIYLLIISIFDPFFTNLKTINIQELQGIRKLCEQSLINKSQIFNQFDKIEHQIETNNKQLFLNDVIKSVISNYRIYKINRIEQIGFIFLMLKRQNSYLQYKTFLYFISTINLPSKNKVHIAKKLLEFCEIKNKYQKIGISENMFSKFLMNCDSFNFKALQSAISIQLSIYKEQNIEFSYEISQKFFKTKKVIKTKNNIKPKNSLERISQLKLIENLQIKQQISKEHPNSIKQINEHRSSEGNVSISKQEIMIAEEIKASKNVKDYSTFVNNICRYLQNIEETKFLTEGHKKFIKNYIIVHIMEHQVQKIIGVLDYFSDPLCELIKMPPQEFKINSNQ